MFFEGRGITGDIDVAGAKKDSTESDTFGIGPLLGASVAIGLVIAGVVVLVAILIRRKTGQCTIGRTAEKPVTPMPQTQTLTRLNSDCAIPRPQDNEHR